MCAPPNNWFAPSTSALVRHLLVGQLFLDGPYVGGGTHMVGQREPAIGAVGWCSGFPRLVCRV
jgi:hypothetical protein